MGKLHSWHDKIIAQAALELAGATEFELSAVFSRPDLHWSQAWQDTAGSTITGQPERIEPPCHFGHRCRTFVADTEGILDDLRTNPPCFVVVNIAATDANAIDLQQNLVIVSNFRPGYFP
jgi:hypothetical protein